MENLTAKHRKLSESEVIEHFGKAEFEEIESINKQIQSFQNQRRDCEDYLKSLPTFFRIARNMRKNLSEFIKEGVLESWNLPFQFGIFVDANVKQTRRNLRKELKDNPRKRILYLGNNSITTQVYVNPQIQSFFEFSLQYSFFKCQELSLDQAQSLFINVSKIAIGLPIGSKKTAKNLQNYLSFMDGQSNVSDLSNLPNGKSGRPKGFTEAAKTIERLFRQGNNPRKIAEILYPNRSPEDKKQLTETISKMCRRIKKTDKN